MVCFKRERVPEAHNFDSVEENISDLPDHLILHILSFLPTKDAAATSILSHRWKNLWVSVPIIDCDDVLLYTSKKDFSDPLEVSKFMSFVDRVLGLNKAPTLNKFRLSCRVCFNASRVYEWLSVAMRHNVEELDLCLFVDDIFILPPRVFNAASLKVLKLEMNCDLQLPSYISFPNIRRLHLCLVTFQDDNLMQKLFASCPFLEELAVLDCEWTNLKRVTISIPSLKTLVIDDLPFCPSDDLVGCEIKIDAGKLMYFQYSGYLSNPIYLDNFSSAALALIHIPTLRKKKQEIANRTVKLFRGLRKASNLRVSSGAIESIFLTDHILDRLPMFQNLKLLELSGDFEHHSIELLMKFLECLPKLESLHILEGLCNSEGDCILKPVPKCFSSSLKTVTFRNFSRNSTQMFLLKFLLKNGTSLEKVNVFCSKSLSADSKSQKKIRNEFDMLPRGSRHCAVMFQ